MDISRLQAVDVSGPVTAPDAVADAMAIVEQHDSVYWVSCTFMEEWSQDPTPDSRLAFGGWALDQPVAALVWFSELQQGDRFVWHYLAEVDGFARLGGRDWTGRDWERLPDGDPHVDYRKFANRSSLLADLALSERVPEQRTDSPFGGYERYELLPDEIPPAPTVLTALNGTPSVPFVLDIWSDGAQVKRVRSMTQDFGRRYGELVLDVDPILVDGALLPVDCPDTFDPLDDLKWSGFESWNGLRQIPLKVTVDDDGVPFEVGNFEEREVISEAFDEFVVPNGSLLVFDGSVASCCLDHVANPGETNRVDFGADVDRLNVTHIGTDGGSELWTLGFRFDVPGTAVARWGDFETAYGTGGGQGAVMALSAAKAAQNDPPDVQIMDEPGEWQSVITRDIDEIPGTDLIVFSNGYGDGAFPMTRGFDSEGRLVSLFVLDERRHPWRLVIGDGEPPADVTERIAQLVDCIAGEREVRADGYCLFDEES